MCYFLIYANRFSVRLYFAGVEQLSSLQHLDLAYNLLLEHAQLAPLSMLHCLNTVCKLTHVLFSNAGVFKLWHPDRLNGTSPQLLHVMT